MCHPPLEPIAVVGIGCRFPGRLNSTKDLWEVLERGLGLVTEVPAERFDGGSFHDPDPCKQGAIRSSKGHFVPDIKTFDAEFFGYYERKHPGLTFNSDWL